MGAASALFLVALLAVSAAPVLGAVGTYDGTEPGFWKERAVVLGRVTSQAEGGRITLEILGVAATDVFVKTRLDVSCTIRRDSALAGFTPENQGIYALCIERRAGGWFVADAYLKFFKSGRGVERVEGPDDPVFTRLLASVAKVRAATEK